VSRETIDRASHQVGLAPLRHGHGADTVCSATVGKGTELNQFSGGDLRIIANRRNTMPRRAGSASTQDAYDHAAALIARTRPSSQWSMNHGQAAQHSDDRERSGICTPGHA
jgi:hypothetical protein